MPSPLTEGFSRFRSELYPRQHALFETLAEDGQHPHTLVIACCDSRVDPAQVFDARPGELFVVRNVANIVPPFEPDGGHHGVSAALEFAVKKLEVPNILVLGHRQCGGVKACVAGGGEDADAVFINQWIEPLGEALADARSEEPQLTDEDALSERVELCSIRRSIERLKTYPFVAERLADGRLKLHGARFGIADGELEWLTVDGEFAPVAL
ncbi:carbonic anhydrase [Marinicauda salina]|uniref:Carbonic anhydrase n=2 Tax=Marinicauda salina TaxID=2135793 RepID=A0A2U2BV10_9PROT|nr:carbonic anhydrase [Marinicauda salina]